MRPVEIHRSRSVRALKAKRAREQGKQQEFRSLSDQIDDARPILSCQKPVCEAPVIEQDACQADHQRSAHHRRLAHKGIERSCSRLHSLQLSSKGDYRCDATSPSERQE